MIIVTGASGQLGRAVVDNLLARVPAEQVGVAVRDPGKVGDLAERGVRVRRGDFGDPATLERAFEGATSVLIVSVNEIGDAAVEAHRAAITAAADAGAKRVLYTSHMGASPSSTFAAAVDHAATEEALRACGIAFTALRNGFYASTVPMLLTGALVTGELRVPEDGAVAWTTRADLAEATARILADGGFDGGFDGATPPLTGPEAVDLVEVAAIASELTGRRIRRVVVTDDEYRAEQIAAGMPERLANLMLGMFAASRHGDFGPAGPALADLLGRPAESIATHLRAALRS